MTGFGNIRIRGERTGITVATMILCQVATLVAATTASSTSILLTSALLSQLASVVVVRVQPKEWLVVSFASHVLWSATMLFVVLSGVPIAKVLIPAAVIFLLGSLYRSRRNPGP